MKTIAQLVEFVRLNQQFFSKNLPNFFQKETFLLGKPAKYRVNCQTGEITSLNGEVFDEAEIQRKVESNIIKDLLKVINLQILPELRSFADSVRDESFSPAQIFNSQSSQSFTKKGFNGIIIDCEKREVDVSEFDESKGVDKLESLVEVTKALLVEKTALVEKVALEERLKKHETKQQEQDGITLRFKAVNPREDGDRLRKSVLIKEARALDERRLRTLETTNV
jgi:hypothetical protein